jgi:hypothetical protein
MSNPAIEEEQSNPYNAKKSWHTPDAPHRSSADSLYLEDSEGEQATLKKAPEKEPTETQGNYKKRYDDLKKHYDNKLSEFKQREQQLLAESRVQSQQEYRTPKNTEDLAKFRESYPDLYDTVETVAHMRSEEQVQGLRQQLSSIQQREAEIMRREAENALKSRHPDFEDIRGDDNFHAWAKEQPSQIQDWVYNNPDDASLASKAIDIYKLETGKGQRSKSNSSAADMVSTKTTRVDPGQQKIWTETEIAKMSLDQFDKHEDAIRQAMIEGRVVK